jgi:DNA-binding XRE family transcriptional regulator
MGMDDVWFYLMLLAYSNQSGRRPMSWMKIPPEAVEVTLGLDRNRSHARSIAARLERVKEVVDRIGRIQISLRNVRQQGGKLVVNEDLTPSRLFHLQLKGQTQVGLFGDTASTRAGWWLEAQEGRWAKHVLHGEKAPDSWTYLPEYWLTEVIDRRRCAWAQRIAAYVLFGFRINEKRGYRVKRTARKLLEICNVDLDKKRDSRDRSDLKRRLQRSLDVLEKEYGIPVEAGESKGIFLKYHPPFEEWLNCTAVFTPPEDVRESLWQRSGSKSEPTPLPDDTNADLSPRQFRSLRRELGLTQAQMAQKLGVDRSLVSKIENGRRGISPAVEEQIHELRSERA